MEPTATIDTNTPKARQNVSVLGLTVYNEHKAVLEWTADDHIRLFTVDKDNNPAQVSFDIPARDISKARVQLSILFIEVNGKHYQIDFNYNETLLLSTGVPLGGGATIATTATAGLMAPKQIKWWIEALRAQGLKVDNLTMMRTYKIKLITIAAFIAFAFLASFILNRLNGD